LFYSIGSAAIRQISSSRLRQLPRPHKILVPIRFD